MFPLVLPEVGFHVCKCCNEAVLKQQNTPNGKKAVLKKAQFALDKPDEASCSSLKDS